MELSYKQYKERKNINAAVIINGATNRISEASLVIQSQHGENRGDSSGNRQLGETSAVSRQIVGEKLRSDTGRGGGTVDRGGVGSQVRLNDENDVQYQSRKLLEDDKENFSTIGVHWGISDGILTKTDARAVWEAIENIQNRGFRGYPKTVTGEHYIESGNKLMIVDTNFRHPRVETIFVFNDTSETNMELAKECLINAQGIQSRLQDAWDFIGDVYGPEYTIRYDCEDSPSYERENPGRERSNSGEDIDGEIQYQQRTDTLTDRRVLELAAEDVRIDDLTQGEVYALDVFKKRLETIRDLQAQRKEQGRYRERKDCLPGEAEILKLCLF